MNHWLYRFWVCMPLLVCTSLYAQTVKIQLDSSSVETGNLFRITLLAPSAQMPDSAILEGWAPYLTADNLVNYTGWEPAGRGQFSATYNVIFFEADTFTLPAAPIVVNGGDTLYTQPWELMVYATPSPNDLIDLAPIKDIIREPRFWSDYMYWVLAALALLLVMYLIYRLTQKDNRQKNVFQRVFSISPREKALKRLTSLSERKLPEQGVYLAYYEELTHIVRAFLEEEYGYPVLEMTTYETLDLLRKEGYPDRLLRKLQELLTLADLVKFAKGIPDHTFHPKAMQYAESVIVEEGGISTST